MNRTADDWIDRPDWSDGARFCTWWATEVDEHGEPAGGVVRCSERTAHDGPHRSAW